MRLYGLPNRSPDTIDFYGDEDVYNALMSRHAERLMDIDIDEIDCASYVPNAEELLIESEVFRVEQGSVLRTEREREEALVQEQARLERVERTRLDFIARENARLMKEAAAKANRETRAEMRRSYEEYDRRVREIWEEHHFTHVMRGLARNLAFDRANGRYPLPGTPRMRIRLIAQALRLTEGEQGFFIAKKDDGFWYLLGSREEEAHRLRYSKGSLDLDEVLTVIEASLLTQKHIS